MQSRSKLSYNDQTFHVRTSRRTQSNTKKHRVKFPFRLPTLLILLVAGYVLVAYGGLKLELHRADTQILALEQERELLLEEHQRLLDQKERLNDPIYIERRAREALGFIKPGEKVLVTAKPGEVMSLKLEGIDEIGD